MKRIIRKRLLTAKEAAQYRAIRERVSDELPDLLDRRQDRADIFEGLHGLLGQLKAARERKGLSLADVTALTGMDRSALSKLESGQRPNPTVDTLARYAEAVGKHLVVQLADGDG